MSVRADWTPTARPAVTVSPAVAPANHRDARASFRRHFWMRSQRGSGEMSMEFPETCRGGETRGLDLPLLAIAITALSLWALGTGCAAHDPSFFELMLSGAAEEGRPLSPELRLECSHPAAEVLLDGVLQGHCEDFMGRGLPLSEGPHVVEIRLSGFLPFEAMVEPGRARMSLRVDLVAVR